MINRTTDAGRPDEARRRNPFGLRRLLAGAAGVVPAGLFAAQAGAQPIGPEAEDLQNDVADELTDRGLPYEFDDSDGPLIAPAPEEPVAAAPPADPAAPAPEEPAAAPGAEPVDDTTGVPVEDPFGSPLSASPAGAPVEPVALELAPADGLEPTLGGDTNLTFAS